jgi:hypothetical protein
MPIPRPRKSKEIPTEEEGQSNSFHEHWQHITETARLD